MYGRRLKAPDKKHIEISGIHRKAVIKTKSLRDKISKNEDEMTQWLWVDTSKRFFALLRYFERKVKMGTNQEFFSPPKYIFNFFLTSP